MPLAHLVKALSINIFSLIYFKNKQCLLAHGNHQNAFPVIFDKDLTSVELRFPIRNNSTLRSRDSLANKLPIYNLQKFKLREIMF